MEGLVQPLSRGDLPRREVMQTPDEVAELVSATIEILHHYSTNEWLSGAHRASVSSGDLPGQGGHHDALCNSRGQRYRA
jgi:hypothetical protein